MLTWRLRSQWLADRPVNPAAAVVAHVAGLQAQDTSAARLGVRVRSSGTTARGVRRAGDERSVVRTWLMRGTLHLVAADDVRWMLNLFGTRNAAAGARRRRQLGLDEDTCARALAAIPEVLSGAGPLSRAELVGRLVHQGIAVDQRGQAPAHLIGYAAAHGVLCRGPELDRDEPGYVLLDEWLPKPAGPPLDGDAALAELTRRYLRGYGPAGFRDLAAWSGLPIGTARRGVELVRDELREIATGLFAPATEQPADTPPEPPAEPVVRLLGAFDTYLLGYADRGTVLDPRYAKRIQAGGGLIHPAVLVDGRVVGRWRLRRERAGGQVVVAPFEPLDPELVPLVAAEAADVGRFLDTELGLTMDDPT